jgi:hypothetical protein
VAPQGAVPRPLARCETHNWALIATRAQIIEEIYDRRYAEDVQELEARCG